MRNKPDDPGPVPQDEPLELQDPEGFYGILYFNE